VSVAVEQRSTDSRSNDLPERSAWKEIRRLCYRAVRLFRCITLLLLWFSFAHGIAGRFSHLIHPNARRLTDEIDGKKEKDDDEGERSDR